MSTKATPFKRQILEGEKLESTTNLLQQNLVDLIDLALLLKQAHWNVVGKNFRSIHLQLDEIIESVRTASDEVAERIAALGIPADGRAATVAKNTDLKEYPSDFQDVQATATHVADSLKTVIDGLRKSIEQVGDLDPVSEDLLIGISAPLEKHLWMVQAQEE
ncbi:DNA starvation/stationary phase protection protein Dps [Roseiconus lacunae]|uniref:DNA starvation/stationary phase protection protein Dps n=1 Tax=Roseiconus lacunae TaxID=2605694 RepID=UPI0011F209E6|nr:DNA starvation/stationary phase protection protein Dps [Roseiconus lacunae]